MQLVPIGDKVVVKRDASADKTPGGIIVPDTAKEKPRKGLVLAVGTGKYEGDRLVPLSVKAGDNVLFSAYSGTEVEVAKEKFLILAESEILAILKQE
jgi:chaperonin GroES